LVKSGEAIAGEHEKGGGKERKNSGKGNKETHL